VLLYLRQAGGCTWSIQQCGPVETAGPCHRYAFHRRLVDLTHGLCRSPLGATRERSQLCSTVLPVTGRGSVHLFSDAGLHGVSAPCWHDHGANVFFRHHPGSAISCEPNRRDCSLIQARNRRQAAFHAQHLFHAAVLFVDSVITHPMTYGARELAGADRGSAAAGVRCAFYLWRVTKLTNVTAARSAAPRCAGTADAGLVCVALMPQLREAVPRAATANALPATGLRTHPGIVAQRCHHCHQHPHTSGFTALPTAAGSIHRAHPGALPSRSSADRRAPCPWANITGITEGKTEMLALDRPWALPHDPSTNRARMGRHPHSRSTPARLTHPRQLRVFEDGLLVTLTAT